MGYTVTNRVDEYKVYLWQNKDFITKHESNRESGLFSESWEWIMPVLEKIENMGGRATIRRGGGKVNFCKIIQNGEIVADCFASEKIISVFLCCVDYILWHNKNISTNDKN